MNIFNNTSNEIHYDVVSPGSGDCGNLEPGGTAEWPGYDNQTDVKVSMVAMPNSPPTPFSVTIPNTGVGKVVTIGLFFE